MLSHGVRAFALAVMVVMESNAFAFDPFTVATVVGAGANAVGAISDAAGEVAASADAFNELYGEIDSDAQVAEDGQKLVQEVREIESLAHDAGYTKDEVEQLVLDVQDGKDGQKLSTTLRAITRAVRTGKRAARLVMRLDKKAQLAQVEQAAISREQLIALYKQLRLERERELNGIKEKLLEMKDKRDQIATLKKEEKGLGALTFGRTGVLAFPKQESVIEEAIKMALQMRPFLLQLILFVFLIRVVFYQFGLFGTDKYGDVIRDAILCSLLLMIFPELIRASVSICNELASKIGLKELHDIDPGKLDFPAEIGLTTKTRLLLEWLFQWAKYLAFVTARFLANFGLAFLILVFPLVIFCSQMLNFSVAWPIFLGGFLSICLWPLFWNATGSLAVMLWKKQDSSLSDQIATILFSVLQFLSPLIGIASLKGHPFSRSMRSAASAVGGTLSGGASIAATQAQGFWRGAAGTYGGGTVGRALAYPVNQAVGRVIAGGLRGAEASKSGSNLPSVLRASAAGVITNHAKAPEKSGLIHSARQTAHGMKHRPVFHGAFKSESNFSAQSGGKDVRKS